MDQLLFANGELRRERENWTAVRPESGRGEDPSERPTPPDATLGANRAAPHTAIGVGAGRLVPVRRQHEYGQMRLHARFASAR